MEQEHLQLHRTINTYREQGEDLDNRLQEVLSSCGPASFIHRDKLGEISETFTNDQKDLHREFIKSSPYYQIVQEAPFYWQIMNKPFGYAGDADLMRLIYRNQFEGGTPFGRLIHKQAVDTKACQAVRNRKELLYNQIMDTIRQHQGEEVRILSVAAGPAQEIQDVLSEQGDDSGPSFLALDHDMHTIRKTNQMCKDKRLRYALANAFHIMKGHHTIACPRSIFQQICNPKRDLNGWKRFFGSLLYEIEHLKNYSFDLVYSAGLYDYIRTDNHNDSKGAVALTKNLYDFVKPGGSLIIGNFSPNNPQDLKFMMEYVYDWFLIYRDKQDMLDFTRSIPKEEIGTVSILEEPLGINYFIKIDKD